MLLDEEIKIIVKRAFENEPVTVIDYKLNSHSDEKVGFLGDHQNLELTIKRKGEQKAETHRFFVKGVPEVSGEQTKFIKDGNIFSQEAAFFNFLFPELKSVDIEEWCPKCFLADQSKIVLEDVRSRGFSMREDKILNGVYLKSAVRAQARLHASSILAEARLGKSMKEVCPQACVEILFTDKVVEFKRVDLSIDLAEKVAKKNGQDHRRIRSALYKGFTRMHKAEQYQGELGRVICHGDTWMNNYMFDASDPPKCLIIDFQLVRYAPRMFDVIQLIYLTTTPEVRMKEEKKVVEAYYEELCKSLECDPSIKKPSMNEILNEFEDLRLAALFSCIVYYPIIGLSKKELNILNNDSETLHTKVMFRQNNDYIMELFNRDEEMFTRISQVVSELVEYCEKNEILAQT